MMKKSLLLLAILSTAFIACNKDNSNDNPEDNPSENTNDNTNENTNDNSDNIPKTLLVEFYYNGSEKDDLSTYDHKTIQYDKEGRVIQVVMMSKDPELDMTLCEDYTYGEGKHLIGARNPVNPEDVFTITWENGEIKSCTYSGETYEFTPSDTPFSGFWPTSAWSSFVIDLILLNHGYFGDPGKYLPASVICPFSNILTTYREYTYELTDGLLTGIEEKMENHISMGDFNNVTTLIHHSKLVWEKR